MCKGSEKWNGWLASFIHARWRNPKKGIKAVGLRTNQWIVPCQNLLLNWHGVAELWSWHCISMASASSAIGQCQLFLRPGVLRCEDSWVFKKEKEEGVCWGNRTHKGHPCPSYSLLTKEKNTEGCTHLTLKTSVRIRLCRKTQLL